MLACAASSLREQALLLTILIYRTSGTSLIRILPASFSHAADFGLIFLMISLLLYSAAKIL